MTIGKTSSTSPSIKQQTNEPRVNEPRVNEPVRAQQEVSQPAVEKPSQVAQAYKTDSFTQPVQPNPVEQSLSPADTEEQGPAATESARRRTTGGTAEPMPHAGDVVQGLLNSQGAQGAAAATSVDPVGVAAEATSGAEAAARLKNEDNYFTAGWEQQRGADFLRTAEAHKDDPAFMRDMYQELGPELTAELMGNATQFLHNDNRNTYQTEAAAQSALQGVAQGLNHMPESFQREVGVAAGKNNPEAALVLKNGASQAAKLGFLEGVKETALGTGRNAGHAARMAGEVIASDPALVQHVADTWASEDVTKLLKKGLELPPVGDSFHSDWASFKPDGLERMVGMAANLQGDQYADFRARTFRDAALALDKSRAGDPNRQSLVDNLKTLFQSDSEGITSRLFNNTGDPQTGFDSSHKALGLLFRDAMFADPKTDDPFTQHVSNFMGDMRAKMLDPSRIDDDPNTKSNERIARELGDVMGSLVTGYSMAAKQNGESQKAREALVSTLVGMAAKPFSVPGGVVGSMAKDQAQKAVSSALANFLNGDLKANKDDMKKLLESVFHQGYAGARDFDDRYQTDVEGAFKNETMWPDFVQQIFAR